VFYFYWIFLGMILMIAGGGMVFGRLQAIATPLIQNMEKVQILPPPKDVDKRVLTWKGASVLGRMEGVTDMWVTGADWVSGG
jgi:actin-related protein 8